MEKDFFKNICKNNTNFLNAYPRDAQLPEELKNHLKHCRECKIVFEENIRLKQILKRAVEKTPVPEDLANRIWEKIQNDERI